MRLAFDEVKATQAASLFLSLAPGKSLTYLKLIKLLYYADREALRDLGLPITTDRHVSMRLGPVTSNIYDRIKSNDRPSFWSDHIRRAGASVVLLSDPGRSELSRAEEKVIMAIFEREGDKDGFALVDQTHAEFPEWKDPGGSSQPIDLQDIIDALNLSEDEAAQAKSLVELQNLSRGLVS